MARILRRPLAGADIDEIWDYIAEDSMVEADAWVDRLDAKLRLACLATADGAFPASALIRIDPPAAHRIDPVS
jgi:plasmid stabilization system protein ParE